MSPILLQISMISTELIENIIDEKIQETDLFLVELLISGNNSISVVIDSNTDVKINDCVNLSRYIENSLDREEEDFDLTVTSFGLDRAFKVVTQYKKHLGQIVEIVLLDGRKLEGKLVKVEDENFSVIIEKKVKIEGKKKKQLVKEELLFRYDEIKSTKEKILFK